MPKILVVTGSVRPNSVNQKIVKLVENKLEKMSVGLVTADLKELNMPFFDATAPPKSPDFSTDHESVLEWTRLVKEADGVVLVTPEYNHTMSPVQLNAIDWIGDEWEDKPVALVGYGWTSGAGMAHATAREALSVNLKAEVGDYQANLFFAKDIEPDGSIKDKEAVDKKVDAALNELLESVT